MRVINGAVLDVAVDLREGSPTYGQYFAIELSEENKKQLFVPRGFAHGFLVLRDDTVFAYKCDNFYNKSQEGGLNFADSTIGIDWQMEQNELVLSERDTHLPMLGAHLPSGIQY